MNYTKILLRATLQLDAHPISCLRSVLSRQGSVCGRVGAAYFVPFARLADRVSAVAALSVLKLMNPGAVGETLIDLALLVAVGRFARIRELTLSPGHRKVWTLSCAVSAPMG
jgi:hypothetical protein